MKILRSLPAFLLCMSVAFEARAATKRQPLPGLRPGAEVVLTCSRISRLKFLLFGEKVNSTVVLYRLKMGAGAPVLWKDVTLVVSKSNPPTAVLFQRDNTPAPAAQILPVQHTFDGAWSYGRISGSFGGIVINNRIYPYAVPLSNFTTSCN